MGLTQASRPLAHFISLSDPKNTHSSSSRFPMSSAFHRVTKIELEVESGINLFFSRPTLNLQGKKSRHAILLPFSHVYNKCLNRSIYFLAGNMY